MVQPARSTNHKYFIAPNFMKKSPEQSTRPRHGVVTFWAIVTIPIFMLMLMIVLEIGNLWLARIQFKNALESGALAAVKTWGDMVTSSGGTDTTLARDVGNQFAGACVVNGVPVDLSGLDNTLNDSGTNTGNDNSSCSGIFVFGSITNDNPEFVVNASNNIGCTVPANVMVDATGESTLAGVNNNDWGISVQPTAVTPAGTHVTRVAIRLPDNFGMDSPVFNFQIIAPAVSSITSDNDANSKVLCLADDLNCSNNGRGQADIRGIAPTDVSFSFLNVAQFGSDGFGNRLERTAVGTPTAGQTGKVLAIDFCDPAVCSATALEPGDRIRFGALVNNGGATDYDGDAIGNMQAQVTVFFNNGTFITGAFQNTTEALTVMQLACSTVTFDPLWGNCTFGSRRGMVFSGFRPDQPPRMNTAGNNQQSVAQLNRVNGGGGFGLAVRAQATYAVPSLSNSLFGIPIGPFSVTARTDVLYDCPSSRPRVYHVDNNAMDFICP